VPVNGGYQREISGRVFNLFGISPAGFGQMDLATFHFYHMAANCAGPRLLYGNNDIRYIVGNMGYYTLGNLTEAPLSVENFTAGEDVTQPGQCFEPDASDQRLFS
jgi:hypothetical protein